MPQSDLRPMDPHRDQPIVLRGAVLGEASSAIILLHGRGASAEDILGLGRQLANPQTALIAPRAAQNTWYPNSFLAPIDENEPWVTSALEKVKACVQQCLDAGVRRDRIALVGFSQGACLASEFTARNAARYAALVAFTGGLIGPLGKDFQYAGDLEGTPALLSSGDPDPHVPWTRVVETEKVLADMGAGVEAVRYINRPHTVLAEEVEMAKELLCVSFAA